MRRLTDADEYKLIRAQIEDPPRGETPLHAFMRHFWDVVDPSPFVDGRHLHAKSEVLEAVSRSELRDVVINEPPGSCKSLLTCVFWPAWHWAKVAPIEAWMFAAFEQALVNRDSTRFLELLKSDRFRGVFPEFQLGGSTQAIEHFYNAHKGLRYSTTPGAGAIGWHFGIHVYDDLIKPIALVEGVAAEHQVILQKTIRWIRETASMRAQDVSKLRRVLIAQRLHEADPSGEVLSEGWDHLCLPEEYDPKATWIIGPLTAKHEWREERGELLWPERRDAAAVALVKKNLKTPAAISAQLQQNPSPATGGIVSKEALPSFRVWPDLTHARLVASFDLSFKQKGKQTSGTSRAETSRVGWHLYAQLEDDKIYLIRAGAQHLGYAATKALVRTLSEEDPWSKADTYLVEAKANGPAIEDDLREDFPRIKLYEPGSENKTARMLPFLEFINQGNLLVPHPSIAPWILEVIEEITTHPRARFSEHWDCLSQALAYLITGKTSYSQAKKSWQAARGRR